MKGIFDRLLEVAHWGAFFFVPVYFAWYHSDASEEATENALPELLIVWPISLIVPAIILYILKGRLILFPWRHRK